MTDNLDAKSPAMLESENQKRQGIEKNILPPKHTEISALVNAQQEEKDADALDKVRAHLEVLQDPKGDRMKRETEIVRADPENVGMVIDHEFIVNPWYLDPERRAELSQAVYGASASEIEAARTNSEIIAQVEEDQQFQRDRVEALRAYLDTFEGKLEHVRIHPPGELSPLSLGAAVQYIQGERRISLPPEYVEQIRMIQERAEDVTLVVSFFNHRNGRENASPIPSDQSREDYRALCEHVIETFGQNISLEFGVEPNISQETDPSFGKSLQYLPSASEVDPEKYGQFYAEMAAALKAEHPDVRCIPAGTAFLDRNFTSGMLSTIMQYEDDHGLARGSLVDALSFHPYRDGDASEACGEIVGGKFVAPVDRDYGTQLDTFRRLAQTYNPDVSLRLGEFNFQNSDQDWERKLRESIDMTKEKGMRTYIYPGFKTWD